MCAAPAQMPRVGDINFYGLRRISKEKILSVMHIATGERIPASRGELEDQISGISGVVEAQVQTVCCDGDRAALFIGVAERGEPAPPLHSPPAGQAALPADVMTLYHQFLDAVGHAAGRGAADESYIEGHALMADAAVRELQQRFIVYASAHPDTLRAELHSGSDSEERAAAAAVIGYAADKKAVVDDLQFAMQDPDGAVRANAAKSLAAIAVLAHQKPVLAIKVSPTWFVELLNSVDLTDRVESTKALLILTDSGNVAALDLIRERALPSLVEMARWPTLRYALPPFLLAGRVAGLPDAQVRQAWENGDRNSVIQKALDSAKKRRR